MFHKAKQSKLKKQFSVDLDEECGFPKVVGAADNISFNLDLDLNEDDPQLWNTYEQYSADIVHVCKGIKILGEAMTSLQPNIWLDVNVVQAAILIAARQDDVVLCLDNVRYITLGQQMLTVPVCLSYTVVYIHHAPFHLMFLIFRQKNLSSA